MIHQIITCDRCRPGGDMTLLGALGGRGRIDDVDELEARKFIGWICADGVHVCPECLQEEADAGLRDTGGGSGA